MTLKNKNPWKIFSIALLAVIAIGLLAPVDAVPPTGTPLGPVSTDLDCSTPCVDETELTFNTATQTELDLTNTALGVLTTQITTVIADLVTETSDRQVAVAAEETARIADVDAEESRATAAESGIASDLATHEAADGDLSDTNEIQNLSVVERSDSIMVVAGNLGGISVPCMEDEILIGGGFRTSPTSVGGNMDVTVNNISGGEWSTRIANGYNLDVELTVLAHCAKLIPTP